MKEGDKEVASETQGSNHNDSAAHPSANTRSGVIANHCLHSSASLSLVRPFAGKPLRDEDGITRSAAPSPGTQQTPLKTMFWPSHINLACVLDSAGEMEQKKSSIKATLVPFEHLRTK